MSTTKPALSRFRLAILFALAAVLLLCVVLAWNTRDSMAHVPASRTQPPTQNTLVEPWQTAVDLAALAVTAEEHRYARDAERLADHEVNKAFEAALKQAESDIQKLRKDPKQKNLAGKVDQLQAQVNQDKATVKSLTTSDAAPVAVDPDNPLSDDLDLANAQLVLDTAELNEAQQALAYFLGDRRGQLEQQLVAHGQAVKKYDADTAAKSLSAVATSQHYGTLLNRLNAWMEQRDRYESIQRAADQTDATAKQLPVQEAKMAKPAPLPANAGRSKTARMDAMTSRSTYKQMQMISSERAQNLHQLSAVYRRWAAQVLVQHRIVFHLLMESVALLALILLIAVALDLLIRYLFDQTEMAKARLGRRFDSVRLVARLSVQLLAVVLVLLLIFGPPREVSTVLGLTTAGLTVVLQDFIISFCGWFVLMSKHGIRVGDWVEINGITGEVADISLFRTALLETGNWTGHGSPTGRRVTFTNSFAIKGQYFNFTTSGQWMWDELTVNVPSEEAYGTVELIHKAVLEETQKESQLAEDEWQHAGKTITADAAVNMRPGATGIDIVVRYVTRAANRYEVRNVLYQRVLEVIHKPEKVS